MTGTRVAILQSNYIPWKGYFDLMNSVDEFILYDCVQYTRSDLRNRNRIRCGDGCCFLTIPVSVPDRFETPIDAVEACDDHWRRKHFQALVCNYGRTPGFRLWGELFRELYLGGRERNLSRINRSFLEAVNRLLGIRTVLHDAREFALPAGMERTRRLVELCRRLGASTYLSGPAAKCYLDETAFREAGIEVEWMNYEGYPEYPQRGIGPFVHQVSVLDLLFNTGSDAPRYMKSFQ